MGIAVEHREVGVEALFDPALLRRLEILGRICRQRGEYFFFRKRPVHQFVFDRGVVDRDEADVGPEQHGACHCPKTP